MRKEAKTSLKLKRSIVSVLSVMFFLICPTSLAEGVSPQVIEFKKFSDARSEIINLIGSAKSRIWISTDYVTDGGIVTALYVAKYRKVHVQVLLGRQKANNYMSRLRYLKKNNIPTFLMPPTMKLPHPTALLTDNRLFFFDSELNSSTRRSSFKITEAWEEQTKKYEHTFSTAAGQRLNVRARNLPLVGRRRNKGVMLPRIKPRYNPQESRGSYTYDKRDRTGQGNAPSKLPSSTVWETRLQDQVKQQQKAARAKQTPIPTPAPAPTQQPTTTPSPDGGT